MPVLIAHGINSPEWGNENVIVYDITHINLSNLKLINTSYPSDKYDDFGRNISSQKRRQLLVPWIITDNASKRFNRIKPADIYDLFQFNHNDYYIWTDHFRIYSTYSN